MRDAYDLQLDVGQSGDVIDFGPGGPSDAAALVAIIEVAVAEETMTFKIEASADGESFTGPFTEFTCSAAGKYLIAVGNQPPYDKRYWKCSWTPSGGQWTVGPVFATC